MLQVTQRGQIYGYGPSLSEITIRGFLHIMPNPKRKIEMKPNLL